MEKVRLSLVLTLTGWHLWVVCHMQGGVFVIDVLALPIQTKVVKIWTLDFSNASVLIPSYTHSLADNERQFQFFCLKGARPKLCCLLSQIWQKKEKWGIWDTQFLLLDSLLLPLDNKRMCFPLALRCIFLPSSSTGIPVQRLDGGMRYLALTDHMFVCLSCMWSESTTPSLRSADVQSDRGEGQGRIGR